MYKQNNEYIYIYIYMYSNLCFKFPVRSFSRSTCGLYRDHLIYRDQCESIKGRKPLLGYLSFNSIHALLFQ